jgi:hypothetical protein
MGILEYLRSRASHKPGKSFVTYGVRMKSARGTAQVERLVSNYVGKLRSATTKNEKNAVERNFMHEYMNIKSRENAELKELEELLSRGSPKKASSGRPPRPPVRRTTPAANAMINKLKKNLRNQISKLTRARNHYQRELNKVKRQLNAIP